MCTIFRRHTFFIVTANMLLTNASNMCSFETIAVYVIIHERPRISVSSLLAVHCSTVRVCTVGVLSITPGRMFFRWNHNTVIAYPCPVPRAVSQANKIFSIWPILGRARFRLKLLHQKIHLIFILNRNKLAIVEQAQMETFSPISVLLCMNSIPRTIVFQKCLTLNGIEQSVSNHLKLFYIHSLHCITNLLLFSANLKKEPIKSFFFISH